MELHGLEQANVWLPLADEDPPALMLEATDVVGEALSGWRDGVVSVPWDDEAAWRIIELATEQAIQRDDRPRARAWMRWMLARDPDAGEGWRAILRVWLMAEGDAAGALAMLDADPDDGPPAGHDRALALYMLGRREEAEEVTREAHDESPAYVRMLLPTLVDRPADTEDEDGELEEAWAWRSFTRALWEKSGALAWLSQLGLPDRGDDRA